MERRKIEPVKQADGQVRGPRLAQKRGTRSWHKDTERQRLELREVVIYIYIYTATCCTLLRSITESISSANSHRHLPCHFRDTSGVPEKVQDTGKRDAELESMFLICLIEAADVSITVTVLQESVITCRSQDE